MKIICIDHNYPDGADRPAVPEPPVWFLRPDTALLRNNDPFYIPHFTQEVRGGCELVVRIDRMGKHIDERFAHRYYREAGLGIGFTALDLLRAAADRGQPWTAATAFDHSAALSPYFIPLDEPEGDIRHLSFGLEVNGTVRQQGFAGDMLHPVDRLIAHVSQFLTLRTGDLLFTGTLPGAVLVRPGDTLRATLGGRTLLDFDIR